MLFKIVLLVAVLGCVNAAIDPALCKLDMVLCLDNSGSIAVKPDGYPDLDKPPANWKLILNFCQDIAKQLTISPTNSQVGLVDFGGLARIDFGLNKYATESEVSAAIATIPFHGDTTNTTGGLYKSRVVHTNPLYGPRTGLSKLVILITDGNPTIEPGTVLAEAQNQRDAGIRVIVVGIGSANETLMKQIAYSPSDYVYANDFSDLDSVRPYVFNDDSCRPLPTLAPTVAPTAAPTTAAPTTKATTTAAPTPPAATYEPIVYC